MPPIEVPPSNRWEQRFVKALATTRLLGDTLTEAGYTLYPGDRYGAYIVQKPIKRQKDGQVVSGCYEVDLANGTCECEQFQWADHKGVTKDQCKHLIWVRNTVTEALRLVGGIVPVAVLPELKGDRAPVAPKRSDPLRVGKPLPDRNTEEYKQLRSALFD